MKAASLGVDQELVVLVVGIGILALTFGCGTKHDTAGASDAGASERCFSPGVTMTGCFCSVDQPPGLHKCGANMSWSPCICPPSQRADKCIKGEPVPCPVCQGESVARTTTCLQDGTRDCACPADAGASTGGKQQSDTDGG